MSNDFDYIEYLECEGLAARIDAAFADDHLQRGILLEQVELADRIFHCERRDASDAEQQRREYFEEYVVQKGNEELRFKDIQVQGHVWSYYCRPVWQHEMDSVSPNLRESEFGLDKVRPSKCFHTAANETIGKISFSAWVPPALAAIPDSSGFHVPLPIPYKIGRDFSLPEMCVAIAAVHDGHAWPFQSDHQEFPLFVDETSGDWSSRDPWQWALRYTRENPTCYDREEATYNTVRTRIRRLAQDHELGRRRNEDPPGLVAKSPSGRVLLFEQNTGPIVNGKKKKKLNIARYDIVLALLKADETGLTKDGLIAVRGGALRSLADMRKDDNDWSEVIVMAGESHMGYRIA